MRLLAAGAVLLTVAMMAGGVEAEPIRIRFSHVVGENTPKGKGANLFKKLVEERLAGKVTVNVYPNSLRFTDDQVLEALLFADVEMAAPSLAKFRNFTKSLQVFDLPFMFDNVGAVHRFQSSQAGRELLDSMIRRGLKGLVYWDNGMRVMSANKPLRVPADVHGLTFRIEPSAVMEAQYAALGATTLRLPFAKVFDALKLGLVSGQENAWSNIYSKKFYHVQKYFTETDHSFLGYMVVTSVKFWGRLPADIRVELEKILAEVTVAVNKIALEKAQGDRQKVIDSGRAEVLTLTPDEREAWRKALEPVWQEFVGIIPRDVIEAAVASKR